MGKEKFKDMRGAHVRIYWSLVDSPAWFALSFSQRALYVACRRKLTSNNNGNLAFTLAGLTAQGFIASSATLASGLRALLATGFVAVTRRGGQVRRGQAIPTLYRFTDEPCHQWVKLDIPMSKATNDWQAFATVEAASTAIDNAEQKARDDYAVAKAERTKRTPRKKSPIQKLKRADSDSGLEPLQILKPKPISDFKFRSGTRSSELAQSLVH